MRISRFTFKHCTEFGIADTYSNVYREAGNPILVGYISDDKKDAWIAGNNDGFQPVEDWRYRFSIRLIDELGLIL